MRSFNISHHLMIFVLTSALGSLALLGYARWAAAPVAAKNRVALSSGMIRESDRSVAPGGILELQDGLIGYWPFDGSGEDLSGAGRDVGLAGGVGFATGLFGQALALSNNGLQYAARPSDDAIYDFGANDFTIQIWVNFNNTFREQTLIEKFSGSAGPGWTLTKLDGNALHFYAAPAIVLTSSPLSISSGVWRHIVVRRSGSSFQIIYDGSVVAAGSNAGSVPDTGMPLLIGKRNDFDGRNFAVDGRIDEVAIWLRALSDEEIAFLFNGGSGNPVEAPNTAPVAHCQNVTVAAGSGCAADASIDNGSFDPDGDALTITQSPPGPYPLGQAAVTLTVTDNKGLSSECTATVTVVDNQAPTITLTGQPITLWPPNHHYKTINVSQLVASASDNCGGGLTGGVVIAQVSSDEPEDAPGGDDGATLNDIVIAADCKSVQLRAERQDGGNGRVYTIHLKVKDAAGNPTRATAKVTVPSGKSGVPAVDDGPAYTVNSACQ